jgi:hypothetical protein
MTCGAGPDRLSCLLGVGCPPHRALGPGARVAADPEVRALGMPTRTAVLRLAIARGLRVLERQYQQPAPADASTPRPTTIPHDATPRSREGTLSHVYAGRQHHADMMGAPRGAVPSPRRSGRSRSRMVG